MPSKRDRDELRRKGVGGFMTRAELDALIEAADREERLREGLRQEIELLMGSPLFYPIGEKLQELLNDGGDDGDE